MRVTKACVALLLVSGVAGCGARSGLFAPGLGGVPADPPKYCTGAGPTPILVVTTQGQMLSFDPPSGSFAALGVLDCSTAAGAETMAVRHDGTAYVSFDDGSMFEVSPDLASCTATAFSDGPNNARFGSCFAANADGLGESLFLFDSAATPNGALVTVDAQTFAVTTVGMASSDVGSAELTGTGDGRLFAFGSDESGETHFAELSPTDATVLSDTPLPIPVEGSFAFAFWGGDFYFFTATAQTGGDSTVARLAADGSFTAEYALLPGQDIVGAGVSTCAPLQ